MVKKIIRIVIWALTAVALIMLFTFGRKKYLETPLKGVDFQLERSLSNGFVVKDSVLSQVKAICGIEHHAAIATIDLMKISQLLNGNPWVESANAYIGLNDTLFVKAKEYKPVLRVFGKDKQSVYVTKEGFIVPPCRHYAPRVIIANGEFQFPKAHKGANVNDSIYAGTGLSDALAIAKAIEKDPFLIGTIGQIYKNENNEYELMVNGLSANVVIGDTCLVDNKLSRLAILLERYSGTEELKPYKTLDLKYKNQIVCTKK